MYCAPSRLKPWLRACQAGRWNTGHLATLLLKSMEIVAHSKKSPFQQKFQKKLYHLNTNSQFTSVM